MAQGTPPNPELFSPPGPWPIGHVAPGFTEGAVDVLLNSRTSSSSLVESFAESLTNRRTSDTGGDSVPGSFVGTSANNGNPAGSFTVTRPSGVQNGDVLLLLV